MQNAWSKQLIRAWPSLIFPNKGTSLNFPLSTATHIHARVYAQTQVHTVSFLQKHSSYWMLFAGMCPASHQKNGAGCVLGITSFVYHFTVKTGIHNYILPPCGWQWWTQTCEKSLLPVFWTLHKAGRLSTGRQFIWLISLFLSFSQVIFYNVHLWPSIVTKPFRIIPSHHLIKSQSITMQCSPAHPWRQVS